jgi:hypothetical protein
MEQALRIRTGCDDSKARSTSLPEMIGYSIRNRAFKARYALGSND